tara:strand:+ start:6305 stop:6544 length:240 start_codon:yes stop_codon:yes gene_type:complete
MLLLSAVPKIIDKLVASLLLCGVVCVTMVLSLTVFLCVLFRLSAFKKGLSQREADSSHKRKRFLNTNPTEAQYQHIFYK